MCREVGLSPITSEEELEAIESAAQLPDPFHGASEHIAQAVTLLSNRSTPDFRNAIKESISAVESAVRVAVGDEGVDIDKGLEKLALHNQLGQAWKNMFNWTSDEDGVRHGTRGTPQVGLSEARYMVVTCSAFVNYLAVKSTEGKCQLASSRSRYGTGVLICRASLSPTAGNCGWSLASPLLH